MNGSLHTIDGRSVLKFERRLAHPPEKVWRAITETEHLAQWFPAEMQGERKQGAPIRFVFAGDEAPPENGEITEYDPPRLFSYTWGESELHWELRPDGDGCLLLFGHTFDERPNAASFATGWQRCLDGLARVLAGRPSPAGAASEVAASRAYRVRHEAYVEVFELLAGTAEPAGRDTGGWLVRFERLLPHPADEVWAALTGGITPVAGDPAPLPATAEHAPPGPVNAVEPEALLAYDSPAGTVRWTLSPGPGGTLVVLTQQAADRVAALAGWHARLESLAATLAGPPTGTDPAELRARYAEPAG